MIEDLRFKEQSQKAYEYAMFLLGIRLRTEGELVEKLRIKNYESGIIEQVISQLKSNRYIDDERFAEVFLDNLKKYKSWGYYGIKKKLMEKKLPADVIANALEAGLSAEEELEIAKRFIKKENFLPFGGEGKAGASKEQKAKLSRKFKAKGFRSEIVYQVLLTHVAPNIF